MSARLLLLHALSPIHCGTGQSVSGIDLPIAREKATNIPRCRLNGMPRRIQLVRG